MTDQTYADRVKDANDEQFRRIVGIKRTTFQAMVELVAEDYRQVHQRRGRRSKLDPEAKVLITLDYLRNYGTFLELSFKYGVSETTARTIVERVENVLVRSGKFSLPNRNELRNAPERPMTFLIDATDTIIQRPKKNSGRTTQANATDTPSKRK